MSYKEALEDNVKIRKASDVSSITAYYPICYQNGIATEIKMYT